MLLIFTPGGVAIDLLSIGLLAEVDDVCGRDGFDRVLEEGESEIIDKIRAALAMTNIEGIDEYGPRLEWTQHWVDAGVGAKLYTASQVQAMLAAVPRNAPLYSPDDVAFPVQRCADGTDALPPELTSIAAEEVAAAEVAAPIAPGE